MSLESRVNNEKPETPKPGHGSTQIERINKDLFLSGEHKQLETRNPEHETTNEERETPTRNSFNHQHSTWNRQQRKVGRSEDYVNLFWRSYPCENSWWCTTYDSPLTIYWNATSRISLNLLNYLIFQRHLLGNPNYWPFTTYYLLKETSRYGPTLHRSLLTVH